MRLVALSDIHIRQAGDSGAKCLEQFFRHPLTQGSTHVALLGDIFDLVAGNHAEYLMRWSSVFDQLKSFCESGKTVYFAEGNHDMHLERLFESVSKTWAPESARRLIVIPTELRISLNELTVLLSHGDEYNQEDTTYLKYKRFIKRPSLRFVADYIMPLSVLDYLGNKASKKSRAYGERTFNEAEVREKFRRGVSALVAPDVDVVVGGHSHVVDHWQNGQTTYLNNGYPPKSKVFVVVDDAGARLEALS